MADTVTCVQDPGFNPNTDRGNQGGKEEVSKKKAEGRQGEREGGREGKEKLPTKTR